VDLDTGEIRASWKPEGTKEIFNVAGTPVVLEDKVIVHTADGSVCALSLSLDKVLWSTPVKGVGFFSGVSNGEVYVVSAKSRLVAVACSNGEIKWKHNLSRLFPVNMCPALAEGMVLFGAANGIFYALDAESGEEIWFHEGDHAFGWTDPVVAFGKVYVGDRGGVINALDLKSGARVWSHKSGVTGLSEPGIIPGNILVGYGKVVRTFEAETGEPDPKDRWFRTHFNPFGSPTLVGETLYFGNLDGHLYAFDYEKERLKWAFEVGEGQQVSDFIYHEGILLVGTTVGLYALGNDATKDKLPKGFILIDENQEANF
jgi:outer membrane protein assembly factor BamB